MTIIAFIGLGTMGYPIATNLRNAQWDVVAYNRTPAKAELFASEGGRASASIRNAVTGASIVITMLPDSPDVAAVIAGPGGVLEHAAPGTLIIDMSTIEPDVSRQLAASASQRQIRFVDAPVSGGEKGAIDGTLSIMVGGSADDFARANEILRAAASSVVHVGPVGAGETVKAANQLLVAGHIQLLAEAIVFLSKHDVPLDAAMKVLAGGLAGSTVIDRKSGTMIAGNYSPSFRVDLHHKDLGIFHNAARKVGSASPLGAVVSELMASLRAQGYGELDHSALLLQTELLSGIDTVPGISPQAKETNAPR